ncbi:MAG: HNH endonuclease, partial [Gammaproteobacteria bacterium]|nr:HNH endonuclease [Gammaproteobacteria bacterium]
IPDGHIVVFRDGNRRNIKIENLELISRAENARRNCIWRYPPELVSTMRLVAKLNKKLKERQDEKQDDRSSQPSVRRAGKARRSG